jgi:hypothetical protein
MVHKEAGQKEGKEKSKAQLHQTVYLYTADIQWVFNGEGPTLIETSKMSEYSMDS